MRAGRRHRQREGRKEDYMYALTERDSVCRAPRRRRGGREGSDVRQACAGLERVSHDVVEGRKEIYMYALTKPHGSCRGSSGRR